MRWPWRRRHPTKIVRQPRTAEPYGVNTIGADELLATDDLTLALYDGEITMRQYHAIKAAGLTMEAWLRGNDG